MDGSGDVWVRRLAACVGMVLGGGGGVVALLWMNEPTPPPVEQERAHAVSFEVRRTPPPKPPPQAPKPPPSKAAPAARSLGGPPSLLGGLSGIDLGLSAVSEVDLGGGERLVGSAEQGRDVVMTQDSVDEAPRPLERAQPAYPARARARNVTGSVTLHLLIGVRGEVLQAKVLSAQPPGVFEEAALEAVKAWRFSPALFRGRAVQVWARQVLRFELS